jgi:hypothetical protein
VGKTELVLETSDLTRVQIFCSNQSCSTGVTYQVQTLQTGIHDKCQACQAIYPQSLIAAVEHFVKFFQIASNAGMAVINIVVER